MDHIEQNLEVDELTRNRFVERAVEAYLASAQNTVEIVQNNHENDQVIEAQTVSEGQQPADGGRVNRIIADSQTTLRDRNVNHEAVEPNHQSDHDQTELSERLQVIRRRFDSNETPIPLRRGGRVHRIIAGLQTPLRERNVNHQAVEPHHQSDHDRIELRERIQAIRRNLNSNETPRPFEPPRPENLDMRSALEKFQNMEIQNEPNYVTNSFNRSNRRTISEYNSPPTSNRPIPSLIAELQTTLRERSEVRNEFESERNNVSILNSATSFRYFTKTSKCRGIRFPIKDRTHNTLLFRRYQPSLHYLDVTKPLHYGIIKQKMMTKFHSILAN